MQMNGFLVQHSRPLTVGPPCMYVRLAHVLQLSSVFSDVDSTDPGKRTKMNQNKQVCLPIYNNVYTYMYKCINIHMYIYI